MLTYCIKQRAPHNHQNNIKSDDGTKKCASRELSNGSWILTYDIFYVAKLFLYDSCLKHGIAIVLY